MKEKQKLTCPSTEDLNAFLENDKEGNPSLLTHIHECDRCRRIVEIYHLMDECVYEQMEPPKDLMKKIIRLCEDDTRVKVVENTSSKKKICGAMIFLAPIVLIILMIILFFIIRK